MYERGCFFQQKIVILLIHIRMLPIVRKIERSYICEN